MRRLITIVLLLVLVTMSVSAQGQQVNILLKNGTNIEAQLIQFNPPDNITISLSGIDNTIAMDEIDTISPIDSAEMNNINDYNDVIDPPDEKPHNPSPYDALTTEVYGQYVVTDNEDYPESFTITYEGQVFTMILVRGGVFNMGYDDNGSRSIDSEPVHKVAVSSFYVSQQLVNNTTAYNIQQLSYSGKMPTAPFATRDWNTAKTIVYNIGIQVNMPCRLITEAEWEYAAITPTNTKVFHEIISSKDYKNKKYIGEWCNDFLDEYKPYPQMDPMGPAIGMKHVARSFSPNKYLWNRNLYKVNSYGDRKFYVRLAISARKIIDRIKE